MGENCSEMVENGENSTKMDENCSKLDENGKILSKIGEIFTKSGENRSKSTENASKTAKNTDNRSKNTENRSKTAQNPQKSAISASKIHGKVDNSLAHPKLTSQNLAISLGFLPFFQGNRGVFFAGSATTFGNGHDLSLLSGFAAAKMRKMGEKRAQNDLNLISGLMGLKNDQK
eukprot:TRINITY_DN7958_c0_g1_i2.p1 TRINITY_DN7958_c0_g1~~TRINITY_DN7958_c0_g1_i2.p1  ORF type:complete len:204 (-),score=34.01 TRINITY_DN7958_c0_g1_i2:81-602(-)